MSWRRHDSRHGNGGKSEFVMWQISVCLHPPLQPPHKTLQLKTPRTPNCPLSCWHRWLWPSALGCNRFPRRGAITRWQRCYFCMQSVISACLHLICHTDGTLQADPSFLCVQTPAAAASRAPSFRLLGNTRSMPESASVNEGIWGELARHVNVVQFTPFNCQPFSPLPPRRGHLIHSAPVGDV